ncbi:hypothetical protein BOTBODRAFT_36278 [Botryobasidium botryosum FD-172 SS1]|uniref:Uncharacterized protein n=1 Tax=Botryobasidium botryosum (strain FD-172 SS1) TaxID=930990 RepID=A0A067M3Q2_BOTB1|nr:hypothetical protein BOTBODRAFT_36278 [Botryobasidium botryosum FD-172 SS1]
MKVDWSDDDSRNYAASPRSPQKNKSSKIGGVFSSVFGRQKSPEPPQFHPPRHHDHVVPPKQKLQRAHPQNPYPYSPAYGPVPQYQDSYGREPTTYYVDRTTGETTFRDRQTGATYRVEPYNRKKKADGTTEFYINAHGSKFAVVFPPAQRPSYDDDYYTPRRPKTSRESSQQTLPYQYDRRYPQQPAAIVPSPASEGGESRMMDDEEISQYYEKQRGVANWVRSQQVMTGRVR